MNCGCEGNNNCCWIIILIVLFFLFCGCGNSWGSNSCGCNNNSCC